MPSDNLDTKVKLAIYEVTAGTGCVPNSSEISLRIDVEANGKQYYANCVWDAYGIAAALHCDAISRASDGSHGRTVDARSESRRAGFETVPRALRCAGGALVGRSHFHLSNHAPLPVGRNRKSVVRGAQYSAAAPRESRATVATGRSLVCEPAHR